MQDPASAEERHAQARMKEMHDLIELLTTWFADVQQPRHRAPACSSWRWASKVQKMLEMQGPGLRRPGSSENRRTATRT